MLPPGRQGQNWVQSGPGGFANNVVHADICFPSRSLEFRRYEAEGTYMTSPSINTLGAESQLDVPGWGHLTWGTKCVLCDTPTPILERPLGACAWFPRLHPTCLSLCWLLCVLPCNHHSWGYQQMLGPGSPSRDAWDLGAGEWSWWPWHRLLQASWREAAAWTRAMSLNSKGSSSCLLIPGPAHWLPRNHRLLLPMILWAPHSLY